MAIFNSYFDITRGYKPLAIGSPGMWQPGGIKNNPPLHATGALASILGGCQPHDTVQQKKACYFVTLAVYICPYIYYIIYYIIYIYVYMTVCYLYIYIYTCYFVTLAVLGGPSWEVGFDPSGLSTYISYIPFITGAITHFESGMSHQVSSYSTL